MFVKILWTGEPKGNLKSINMIGNRQCRPWSDRQGIIMYIPEQTLKNGFNQALPEKPFYWIFHDKDGSEKFYKTDLDELQKFILSNGKPNELNKWAYNKPVCEKCYSLFTTLIPASLHYIHPIYHTDVYLCAEHAADIDKKIVLNDVKVIEI